MTMRPNPLLGDPTKSRVVIATYPDYLQAQRAVDYLSDQKFAVERTAIVGEGLKLVEQVTGRLDWTRALSLGMGQGATTGIFIGLVFAFLGFGGERSFLTLLIDGLLIGVMIGAVWGLLSYALSGGRRDFTSVGGMRADHYSVMADGEVAEQARDLLSGMPHESRGS
ncbi:glycine zipper family protein [Deinococcus psychrotolerans]|uniref:Glycine zipper family protein n=1 Tax=Deinococcus psychrotolerans TaxID=2489213 RepID=A0A3G8YF05_9DEIO|nr:general stress protein [Deinococcus psychrotolerans]AZI43470.1 glycine zipper family protein [Deinococcus psychrotolerans]